MPFYIADVFAGEKHSGNQLAVVRGVVHLSDAKMQESALEMDYSETTSIGSEEARYGGHDVRILPPRGSPLRRGRPKSIHG